MSSTKPTNVILEMSIEETNKIRLSLGLKPLDVSNSNSKPQDPATKKETTTTSNKENGTSKQLKDTLESLKQKRESRDANVVKGKSIAAQLMDNEEEEEDLSAWIQRSREKQQQQDKQKQNNKSNQSTSKNSHYSSKDLQGLKVTNKLENFEDGNEHILVLKDSNVLDDEDSELVDITLAEKEKREKQIIDSKKGRNSKYDQLDQYGNQKEILSHYDDNVETTGFVLSNKAATDSNNQLNQMNQQKNQEDIKSKLKEYSSYALDSSSVLESSFYTKEEMDLFKKPSTKKSTTSTKKKKKRTVRESKQDDEEDKKFSLSDLDATTTNDKGSRKTRRMNSEDVEMESQLKAREDNYQKALNKASAESKLVYSDFDQEVEDDQFYSNLAKATKAPIMLENNKVVEMMQNRRKQLETKEKEMENMDDGLYISTLTEFVKGINPNGRDETNQYNVKVEKKEKEDEEPIPVKKEKPIKVKKEDDEDQDMDDNQDNENEDEDGNAQEEDENEPKRLSILEDEPEVSGSMSAALKLLVQKGEFKQAQYTTKKLAKHDDYEPIVQHKDEFGRVLNRKEAFIAMSQIFHGKKSGKNKRDKIKKRHEEEMANKRMTSSDTPLSVMSSMQKIQEKTALPYVVLSGGPKTMSVDPSAKISKNVNVNKK